ncbi:MAG: ATP-binding cassette domain-containing protein [Candidatus Saccharimonadales bacterium]
MDTQSLISQLLDAYHDDVTALGRDVKAAVIARRKVSKKPKNDYSDKPAVVELRDVSKTYKLGKTKVQALDTVSLTIHEGEMVALLGKSGSGKSTLLHMIGGLDKPTSGDVLVDGVNLRKMRDE